MNQKKRNPVTVWLCVLLSVAGLIALISLVRANYAREQERVKEHNKAIAFQTDMAALVASANPDAITGNKAVAAVHESKHADPEYTSDYIPEALRTEDVAEVRYIVKIFKEADMVGTYSNGGGFGFRHRYDAEILDLKTRDILDSTSFRGGEPPYTVKSSRGTSHYGSEPSRTQIENWVLNSINNYAAADVPAAAVTEVTVYARVPNGWYGPGCWVWSSEGVDAFDAWPGEPMTLRGDWYTITVPAWIDYVIINANNGATQTADLPVEAGRDVWVVVNEYGEAQVFYENPLN